MGFGLSGNFSCEVTADAPLFSTATAFGAMQVVGKLKNKCKIRKSILKLSKKREIFCITYKL